MFRATNSPILRNTLWLYIQFWYNAAILLPTGDRLENLLGFLKRYIILHGTVQWSSVILLTINYSPSFNLGTVFVPCSTMSHISKIIYRRWSEWICRICTMLLTGENGGTPRKTWIISTLFTKILHGLAWNETRTSMSNYTKFLLQCCPSNDKFSWVTKHRRFYQQKWILRTEKKKQTNISFLERSRKAKREICLHIASIRVKMHQDLLKLLF